MGLIAKKTRGSARGALGLDLDSGFIAATEVAEGRVLRAVSSELAPGVINDGEVADPAALGEELKEFFKEHGLSKRVRLGVANQQIVMRQLELPRLDDPKDLAAAIRFQAAEAIAMPLEEAILDHQVVGDGVSPEGAPTSKVMLVAARSSMIERILEAVRGAGLRPEGIDLNAFALVRALAEPGLVTDDAKVYCHLGGTTNLAVALAGTCLFARPLSTSWEEEGDHVGAALAEEIRLSIDFYMSQPEAVPVGEVCLSGPGSAREGLADELGSMIGLPVSLPSPLGGLGADGMPDDEDPRRHTVAAGLAMGAAA